MEWSFDYPKLPNKFKFILFVKEKYHLKDCSTCLIVLVIPSKSSKPFVFFKFLLSFYLILWKFFFLLKYYRMKEKWEMLPCECVCASRMKDRRRQLRYRLEPDVGGNGFFPNGSSKKRPHSSWKWQAREERSQEEILETAGMRSP